MASRAAYIRLRKEYLALIKQPTEFIVAKPTESNILKWYYIINGPPSSPYEGGEYFGKIVFPTDYPFKPPSISMCTPNGRFRTDFRLCLSMSDYHPASWNPSWSVETILKGLLSFMLEDEVTTGSIKSTLNEKRAYAQRSHEWNLKNRQYKDLYPERCEPISAAPEITTILKSQETIADLDGEGELVKRGANLKVNQSVDPSTTSSESKQENSKIAPLIQQQAQRTVKSSQYFPDFTVTGLLPMGILTVIGSLIAVKVIELISVMTL